MIQNILNALGVLAIGWTILGGINVLWTLREDGEMSIGEAIFWFILGPFAILIRSLERLGKVWNWLGDLKIKWPGSK
jgi:hypothetical protein